MKKARGIFLLFLSGFLFFQPIEDASSKSFSERELLAPISKIKGVKDTSSHSPMSIIGPLLDETDITPHEEADLSPDALNFKLMVTSASLPDSEYDPPP